ncbi:MAG: DUF695 domain-containing protein [Muribaculaceae bacterium]|nr:DUF695 domain-containing protein [Muribaculaceae bacterium]
MADKSEWWTAPTESETGNLIMVTGRRDVDAFKNNPRFNIRVEVTWKYIGDKNGMPDVATSTLMEQVQDALTSVFAKDPVAIMTGIYTGDGERNWVFYTLSTNIFGKKINEALQAFDLLPLTIYCENDPDWNEYQEMKSLTEIHTED